MAIVFVLQYQRTKTTAKLSENSWNKRRSERFHRRHLWRQWLYCYPFLSVAQHESGTRKAIFLVSDRI
jgi:hypothetical protein